MPDNGKYYRILEGNKVQWWICADCGRDLGPAAAQYRTKRSAYPFAFNGRDGRCLCGSCLDRESGRAPAVMPAIEAAHG